MRFVSPPNYNLLLLFACLLSTLLYYWAHRQLLLDHARLHGIDEGHAGGGRGRGHPAATIGMPQLCASRNSSPTTPPAYWANTELRVDRLIDAFPFDRLPMADSWDLGFPVAYDALHMVEEEPRLEVVVMPHSHLDPGYKESFADAYREKLGPILSNAVKYLTEHSDITFEVAEMSVLEMWWRNNGAEEREAFKRLVENGQLEILTGGWVMSDEANTHYYGLVMQLLEGHEWLRNHMPGITPTSHWNIDSFGLSPTVAYLMGEAGLRYGVAHRMLWTLKSQLAKERQLEFRWRQLWAGESNSTDFLIHTFPLAGFHVSESCGIEPRVCCTYNFERVGRECLGGFGGTIAAIEEHNLEERVNTLVDQLRKRAQLYKANVVFVPWGEDVVYVSEADWAAQHENLLRLFAHINSQPYNIHIGFGTLTQYFELKLQRLSNASASHFGDKNSSMEVNGGLQEEALSEDSSKLDTAMSNFPTLSGDFFPYASWEDAYWTGYFTTRPFHKHMARTLENLFRTADLLFSFAAMAENKRVAGSGGAGVGGDVPGEKGAVELPEGKNTTTTMTVTLNKLFPRLIEARRTVALMQHHDSITGTTKRHIMEDYAQSRHARGSEPGSMEGVNNARVDEQASKTSGGDEDRDFSGFHLFADRDFIEATLPQQRVLLPGSELVLFNSLAFERVEVICVLVPPTNATTNNSSTWPPPQSTIYETIDHDGGGEGNTRHNWRPLARQQLEPVIELLNGTLTLASDKQKLCFLTQLPALGFRRLYLDYAQQQQPLPQQRKVEMRGVVGGNEERVKIFYKGKVNTGDFHAERLNPKRLGGEATRDKQRQPSKQILFTLANGRVELGFDPNTGHLKEFTPPKKANNRSIQRGYSPRVKSSVGIDISFVHYCTAVNRGNIRSGVYKFVPEGPAWPMPSTGGQGDMSSSYVIIEGPVRKSVVLKPAGPYHLMHTIEIDADSDSPAIHNLIDLSAYHHRDDVEVAMRLMSSKELTDFYTQLNSHQFIRHQRHRNKMPIMAHFLPMPGTVFLENPQQQRLSLIGRQPLGVASLEPGWIEVVLDRRLTGDDDHGFGEGLLDNRPTESSFRLMWEQFFPTANDTNNRENPSYSSAEAYTAYPSLKAHRAALQLQYPVMVQYSARRDWPSSKVGGAGINSLSGELSLLGQPLPCDVHMVALRVMSAPTEYNNDNPTGSHHGMVSSRQLQVAATEHKDEAFSLTQMNNSVDDGGDRVEFTSLATTPRREAALVLHRAGLELDRLRRREGGDKKGADKHAWDGSYSRGCLEVESLFSEEVGRPKRVAKASLTLLKVARDGEEGGNVQTLELDPMEIKSWLVEF